MDDTDSHLKLLFPSTLDTYKVIEHIDMLSMGIQYQPYTVIPTLLGSDFGALGHLQSQNDEIMSWLRPWLGNPFGIPRNCAINPILDLFNSGIFIGILFFRS
jgi:hypothetical protein